MQTMAAREAIIVDDVADLSSTEIHRFAGDEASTGPFSCFPILTGDQDEAGNAIGVLSVDACRKAHRLLPQAMSVEALYAFLLRMGLNDAAVELKRRSLTALGFLP